MQKAKFKSLISSPWAVPPESSYYGDPGHLDQEQHGLEHIERGKDKDGDAVEQVVILGYN
ncbi:MAG: hypothetical protein ACI9LO_000265 [Planctomycetota bacterium]|jgi:hypothetical protein